MNGQVRNGVDELLANSLKFLATEKPIEKITIKEITDQAGVIRPTFYNHFQDKYELMEWIITTQLFEPIRPLIQNGMATEGMVFLLNNIGTDRAFYMKAFKMEGPISFHDVLYKCVTEEMTRVLEYQTKGKERKKEWVSHDMVARYYAQSICFMMEEWIRRGMDVPPKQMADLYQYIVTHSMTEMFGEM